MINSGASGASTNYVGLWLPNYHQIKLIPFKGECKVHREARKVHTHLPTTAQDEISFARYIEATQFTKCSAQKKYEKTVFRYFAPLAPCKNEN